MNTTQLTQPGTGNKVIMDPVHGAINLLNYELKVIDHPLFQRLRHVCQNDMLFLVFPGATHTRFAHSIGVMHMASRIFDELVSAHLNHRNSHLMPIITNEQRVSLHYLLQCLRLAALLHDTGHGSFSHQLESVSEVKSLRSTPQFWESLWKGAPSRSIYPHRPSKVMHEHYSVRAAYEILRDINIADQGIAPEDILGIMETTECECSDTFKLAAIDVWEIFAGTGNNRPECKEETSSHIKGLLKQVLSGEFDADKSDYMLRDSQYSSVSYGLFNVDNLLKNLRCFWEPSDNWLGLCVQRKGLPAFEDFVYSRFQLYSHVYNHKTAVGMDLQLHKAIAEVLTNPETSMQVRAMLTDINEFEYLTDAFFWERFREHSKAHPDSFSATLLKRLKLRHVGTEFGLPAFRVSQQVKHLAEQLECLESDIFYITNKARFSRICNGFTDFRVLAKDPITKEVCLRTLSEESDFFTKFNDIEITHFYLNHRYH